MIVSPVTTSRAPLATSFTTGGSYSFTIPSWCTHVDIVMLGGGGGGGGGDTGWAYAGQGGFPGNWSITTLERGKDIAWSATTISGTIGAGGNAGSAGANGNSGGSTTAIYTNTSGGGQTLTVTGGAGGSWGNNGGFSGEVGKSPGSRALNSQTYSGGGTAVSGASRENGKTPGGGGGGGNGGVFGAGTAGMPGATGGVFIYAYMKIPGQLTQFTNTIDTLADFAVYSSGTGIATVGGIAQWSGTTAGQAIALYGSLATTSNQYAAAVLGTVSTAGSGIILHSDASYTGYYGAVFYNTFVKIIRTSGRWTQNTITEIVTFSMTVNSGDLVEFWNIGAVFKIAVNGTERITHTVSSPVIGPAYRHQGFGIYRTGTINSTQITEWRGGDAAAWGKS